MKSATCHSAEKHFAKGLCARCYKNAYQRSRAKADPNYHRAHYQRHKANIAAACRRWYLSHKVAALVSNQQWRGANPDAPWLAKARRLYGLTAENIAEMLAAQGHACGICTDPFVGRPHIDHCHAIGTVRGLLCGRCNHMLGHARDSIVTLSSAAQYLRRAQVRIAL